MKIHKLIKQRADVHLILTATENHLATADVLDFDENQIKSFLGHQSISRMCFVRDERQTLWCFCALIELIHADSHKQIKFNLIELTSFCYQIQMLKAVREKEKAVDVKTSTISH